MKHAFSLASNLPLLAITTVAPRDASSMAIDLPMPLPPPVTNATLPANRVGRYTLFQHLFMVFMCSKGVACRHGRRRVGFGRGVDSRQNEVTHRFQVREHASH